MEGASDSAETEDAILSLVFEYNIFSNKKKGKTKKMTVNNREG